MIETQYNAKVRVLRSDNGGEYQSSDLQKYLEEPDIIHQTTCSNTPQQNGVAEQKNRHLLEVVRASLIAAKILISYWGEAITSTAYLINRVPSSSINFQTPLQALTNVIAAPTIPNLPPRVLDIDVTILQLNECLLQWMWCFMKIRCIFSSESELPGEYHKEIQTLDYDYHIFEEDEYGQSELVNQEAGELDMSGQQFGSEDVFTEIPNQSSSAEGVLNLEPDPFMNAIPNSVQEALVDPRWKAAMNEDMKSLQKNETWELVECPLRKKPGWVSLDLYCEETGMSGCQPVNTPIEKGPNLCVEPHQVSTDKKRYQRLVGRLMYLAHTRPDLAYALSVSIEVYTDVDWGGAMDDGRSTSGYFTFVGGNLVTWKSKKQFVVARSSAEAEFRGMALGLYEALWLRLLLQDLGYLSRQPIRLFCDNKAACDIAHNPVQHDRTKHVEVDRLFIKEKLDDKIVELPKILSEGQLADILTKAVSSQVFSKILDKLGMCDIYAPT
ncbi:Retrovirus-related Pol polyprotein from transposon RE1 [Vitis vinifera]|uniref:Retrovirus-related Pol polyprotein from transposon RE1 n=1 Tax=Vitis vinifera TaxID=29760 RepID=A0A438FRY8_VITVI|nr:Retrovirus-related Pol polyprotein from transposon RE1 [Vitis vinifera]